MSSAFFISIIVVAFFDIGVEYFLTDTLRIYPVIVIIFSLLGIFL